MSDYRNEEGEFLMTAAELRFEAELDAESAHERYMDELDRYDHDFEPDPDECCDLGDADRIDGVWVCHWCDEPVDGPDEDGTPEHQWQVTTPPDVWLTEDAAMEYGLWGSEA